MGWMIWYLNTRKGKTFLQKHPDQDWDPPSLLVNRYQNYFLEVKQPGREAAHSPTSSAEVQDEWSHTLLPLRAFISWTGTTLLYFIFTQFQHASSFS